LEPKKDCEHTRSSKGEEEAEEEESKSQSEVQDHLSDKTTESLNKNEIVHFSAHEVSMMNCNSEGSHLPHNE